MNVKTISLKEFLEDSHKVTNSAHLILVPDTVTQRALQTKMPLAQILRRDEWIAQLGQERSSLFSLLERSSFLNSIVGSLSQSQALECPPSTFLSISMGEALFSLFDELLGAGVWSQEALDLTFQALPKTPFYRDLSLILRVLQSEHPHLQSATDSTFLSQLLESSLDKAPPLYLAGFHRFTFLEKEIHHHWGRTSAVYRVIQEPHRPTTPMKVHWFDHFHDECAWIATDVLSKCQLKTGSRYGIILPTHPDYMNELLAAFHFYPEDSTDEACFSFLESMIESWLWFKDPVSLKNPMDSLKRHPYVSQLSWPNLESILQKSSSLEALFKDTYRLLGFQPAEQKDLALCYRHLEDILKFPVPESFSYWTELFRFYLEKRKRLIPPPLVIENNVIEFLDYRSSHLTLCDETYFPAVNDRFYPPKLPENPLLPESTRSFLSEGSMALPLLTAKERLEAEKYFFSHNVAPQGRLSLLSGSTFNPLSQEGVLSPFFKHLNLPIEMHAMSSKKSQKFGTPLTLSESYKTPSILLPSNTRLNLSSTQIETYIRCPFQFYLRYQLRIEKHEEEDYLSRLDLGKLIHAILEKTLQKKMYHLDEAFFEETFQDLAPESIQRAPAYFHHVVTTTYFQWAPAIQLEIQRILFEKRKPLFFEYSFENVKVGGAFFSGKIDRIDEVEGGLVIVDYKTGRNHLVKDDIQGEGLVMQPFLYASILEKLLEKKVLHSELVYLREENEKRVIRFPRVASETRLEALLHSMKSQGYKPNPFKTQVCQSCDYHRCCPIGANL